jgi:hypothetical protein
MDPGFRRDDDQRGGEGGAFAGIGVLCTGIVMADPVPAIHDFLLGRAWSGGGEERKQSVDGRHKAGHDDQ